MNLFVWAILWAIVAGMPFALLGALFGAGARVVARRFELAPESTVRKALRNGVWAGGVFVGIIGFALGGVLGLSDQPAGAMLEAVLAAVLALTLLMFGALLFGGLAFVLQRLGTEWTLAGLGFFVAGLFLALPIRDGFLRTWPLEGRDISELRQVLIWCGAIGVGVASLLIAAAALWAGGWLFQRARTALFGRDLER